MAVFEEKTGYCHVVALLLPLLLLRASASTATMRFFEPSTHNENILTARIGSAPNTHKAKLPDAHWQELAPTMHVHHR